jgi:hypothetical protein
VVADRAHFCDADEPDPNDGQTLLDRLFTLQGGEAIDPDLVHPQTFIDHFTAAGANPETVGTLPFRVWQLYELMVRAVAKGNSTSYLAAAGVLAHYVGDACQPLHGSFMHNGIPGDDASKGVHSAFETRMLDSNAIGFLGLLNAGLGLDQGAPQPHGGTLVTGGRAATCRLLELMRDVQRLLPPEELCSIYASDHKVATLWLQTGERAAQCAAMGARTLATLWESAWVEGGRKTTSKSPVSKKSLAKNYYDKPTWAPCFKLTEYAEELGLA